MLDSWTRRLLLTCGAATAAAAVTPRGLLAADPPPPVDFPRQPVARVREMVGVSHGNFARVKELVSTQPALAKAAVDWGFGDWESAIDAASHVGHREIALFLLDHGARPTLFSAAMLGQLATVRAHLEAHPGAQKILGPHSITLLAHARAGGEPARAVVSYLEALGGADERPVAQPLPAEEQQGLLGAYVVDGGAPAQVELVEQRGSLMLLAGDAPARGLIHLGGLQFLPVGAEAVRVRVERRAEGERVLTVLDPDVVLTARRRR